MATTASIKIVKTMPYRGELKRWSNRYHFTNGLPTTDALKEAMADGVVAQEKAIYSSAADDITIVEALYYDAGSDVPVWTKSYSVAGTGSALGGTQAPGDVAALVRYSTTQRTSKNHPVYLFNYYHGARHTVSETDSDELPAAYKSALEAYANQWVSGFNDGTTVHKRCGPNGAVAQGSFVEGFLTHRDFPR